MIDRNYSEEERNFFNEDQDLETTVKRPKFILVLVILSGINIVTSMIGALSGMLGSKPDQAMIKSTKLEFANMREQLQKADAEDFILWFFPQELENDTVSSTINFLDENEALVEEIKGNCAIVEFFVD